jgi:hypothetical protein
MIDALQERYGYVVYAVLSVMRPEDKAFIERERETLQRLRLQQILHSSAYLQVL